MQLLHWLNKNILENKRSITILSVIIIFAFGLILRLTYLSYTPYNYRGHDVDGHIDYIKYVFEHQRVPTASTCWQCYHPPVYYFLAAPIYAVGQSLQLADAQTYQMLQLFSLLLNLVFVVGGYILIWKIKIPIWAKLLGLSLFTFWPVNIIHSVRIGNDALFYPLSIFFVVFLFQWWETQKYQNIYLAAVCAALGLATKSNGLVLIAILGIVFVANLFRAKLNWQKLFTKFAALAFDLGLILAMGAVIAYGPRIGKLDGQDWLVSNQSGLGEDLALQNRSQNYLWFDLETFLNKPNISPWSDQSGRQFYANYLLKTSLFGEFNMSAKTTEDLAIIISAAYLIILGVALLAVLRFSGRELINYFVLGTTLHTFIIASLLLRWRIPFSPSNDFRYVMTVLPIGIILFLLGMMGIKNKIVKAAVIVICCIFILASVAMFLAPALLNGGVY